MSTPVCVTVNVFPAIVIVPVRSLSPEYDETEYATVPELWPDAPEEIVIQDAFDRAVHEMPGSTVTETVPLPPDLVNEAEVELNVASYPYCVTVCVLPEIEMAPVRVPTDMLASTI